jgi:glycosyltransferase involved in cell wall biosynthesis
MMSASKDGEAWAVPAYNSQQLAPRASKFALCVFVLNEGERILSQLRKLQRQRLAGRVDIVIADGGSTDGVLTEATLRPLGVTALLTKTGPGKLSAQMRMALAHVLEQGYEGVVVMDGNDKDDPAAIPAFLAALEAGHDHVQGSRFVPGGKAVNTPRMRWWGIRLVHAPLISIAAGFRYTDTTNGFRAYSRRLLLDPRVAPFRSIFSAYELHYYLAIRAARLGFRITELPVTRSYPAVGKTPTKIHGWRGNYAVLKTLWAACRHQFDPA